MIKLKLVEKRVIKKSHPAWSQIDEMAFASKNLYNTANYTCRQAFFYLGENKVPNYDKLYHLIKETEQYKALPSKIAQQTLKLVAQNWTSYFEGIKEYKLEPEKFTSVPKPPKYLDKDGRYIITFTAQATSKKVLRDRLIKLSSIDYIFDCGIILGEVNQYCQSRIVPKLDHYVLEIVYEVPDVELKRAERQKMVKETEEQLLQIVSRNPELNKLHITLQNRSNYLDRTMPESIASVDLGVSNLMAITSNVPGFQPVLINGRPLKSINQFFNKRRAQLQSDSGLRTSKRLKHLTTRRNHKVKDYLHRASTYVINLLKEAGITVVVVGKNVGWKQKVNIGSANNQQFVQIPHAQLIDMLTYKGALVGITVIAIEESYTSKSSFLERDFIPEYGKKPLGWKPSGKRIHRGLFRTNKGVILNADVNGSYNILRKAFPNAFVRRGQ